MKGIRTGRFALGVLLLAALLAAHTPTLQAQSSFILSRNEDFSTDDRVFARSDVLHIRVTAVQIDFADLEKNAFRLKPDEGGNDIEGVFTNHSDGVYTASVSLASTDPSESDWEWRARIEDDAGNKFEARVTLQIGDEDDGGNGEDDDEDDEDDEVEFTGVVEALGAGSITVDGITFVVTDETVVLDDDNNPISFADLAVGMTVEIRGDRMGDTLVATRVKIEDPPAAAGRIETMEDDRLTVEARTFLIDAATRVLDAHAVPIAFSDLDVGLAVAVHARADGSVLPVAAQVKIVGDVAAAIEADEADVPGRFVLEQNYPNPFNPETTIAFELVEGAREQVSLVVYTILGEAVRTLVQGALGPGRHQYTWDGRNQRGHFVASGLYLYRLRVGDHVQTRRMVLLK
jgi:hypothetical protein